MKNRANPGLRAQVDAGLLPTAAQLLLPMIEGIVHSRRELFAWIQQVGINALEELFELDVVEMAGPKGKHCPIPLSLGSSTDRTAFRRPADNSSLSASTSGAWRRGTAEK